MSFVLDFEKPLQELEDRLDDLKRLATTGDLNLLDELATLEKKSQKLLKDTYARLTPWQTVQVARHPNRPHTSAYIEQLIENFVPLCGDRAFGEDPAILAGMGSFRGTPVMVMGHEKGHDLESRVHHNFGMPRPEGYRKVKRLMDLAHRFGLPILTFIDTAGAHPGADAEERGQSEAIASCLEKGLAVEVPFVTTIIGEGGSGGAVALATANTLLMLEYSVYSVISPEGCASILWRTREKAPEAALAQKMTAKDLLALKVIDGIIPEVLGGAHRNPVATIDKVGNAVEKALFPLLSKSPHGLVQERRQKFLRMGRAL